jgi:hypothetical protein
LLPQNFLVDEKYISSLIMMVLHNAMKLSFEHHDQVKRLITSPLNRLVGEMVRKYEVSPKELITAASSVYL